MKLTERQIAIRRAFREHIVDVWHDHTKSRMFNARNVVAEKLQIPVIEVTDEFEKIPSIGHVRDSMPVHIWTAKYFNPVANALWDGKSKEQVLALWGKCKRTTDSTPKLGVTDRAEHAKIRKNHRKLQALAELAKNRPDRWQKTSWGTVK